MPAIALPPWLEPSQLEWSLLRSTAQFRSPTNRVYQAVDLLAEQWMAQLTIPEVLRRDSGRLEAFINQLVGGVQTLALHPQHRREPTGTLRGSPTLNANTAQFANTFVLAGCSSGVNLLLGGNFEVDTNADGLANNWQAFYGGTTGARSYAVSAPGGQIGAKSQHVEASNLGTTSSDYVGIKQTAVPVSSLAGGAYCFSIYAQPSTGPALRYYIEWRDGAAVYISSSGNLFTLSPGWHRYQDTGPVPAGAVTADVYVWIEANAGGPGLAAVNLDGAQLESGSVPTDFEAFATLKVGDFIGLGGQVFQLAADAAGDGSGLITISTVNRARTSFTAGAAASWNRPTATFAMLEDSSHFVHRPASMAETAITLVEVV